MPPTFISATFIDRYNNYPDLIELLRQAFADDAIEIPDRLHYSFGSNPANRDATLLVMPAWQHGKDVGIKLVTINPGNGALELPAVQGNYLLLDAVTGQTRAILDGKALTRKRTAA
ncbi:MAG: ornithine cyclodeaminase family protein, partial [Lewinella sp.]|nr:ornithine cyclodeaminase family protein [Lewinella sp.]